MSKDQQQKRGGFVPLGDLALDLPGVQVPGRRRVLMIWSLDRELDGDGTFSCSK